MYIYICLIRNRPGGSVQLLAAHRKAGEHSEDQRKWNESQNPGIIIIIL